MHLGCTKHRPGSFHGLHRGLICTEIISAKANTVFAYYLCILMFSVQLFFCGINARPVFNLAHIHFQFEMLKRYNLNNVPCVL